MLLAHGGVAGGVAEAAILLTPLVVIALLALRARRIERRVGGEEGRAGRSDSSHDADSLPATDTPNSESG